MNGEAIYGSKTWRVYGEGPSVPVELPPDWKGGSTAQPTPMPAKRVPGMTAADFRFTTNRCALYIFGFGAGGDVVIRELAQGRAEARKATLLGSGASVVFEPQPDGLHVKLPAIAAHAGPFVLKVEGSQGLGIA